MKHARRAGVTLVEVLVALAIVVSLLAYVTLVVHRDARALSQAAAMGAFETRAQEMLARLEEQLSQAQGTSPEAWLNSALGPSGTTLLVDTTIGFPDRGSLLLDPGGAQEERLAYTSLDAFNIAFDGLTRGEQCTTAVGHAVGTRVWWVGQAEVLVDQVAPPASQWDGVASETAGPRFFRGDGAGFSFRVPTDPAGGTNYLAGGDVTWGATVGGAQLLTGWSALYFQAVAVASEATRGVDINRDGDLLDTFDVGQVRLRSWDSADPTVAATDIGLCPTMVLQEQCNWGGDLDADGFDDPLFLWNPATQSLHIRLSIIGGADGTRPRIRRVETTLFLRNSIS